MSSWPPLNRVGLRLPCNAIGVLREHGIFAQSSVSLEHQHLAKCYVIHGVESGGAAGDVGHYVTFAHENGQPLECFCPVETTGVNRPQAIVLAPALVRIEMLRKRWERLGSIEGMDSEPPELQRRLEDKQ